MIKQNLLTELNYFVTGISKFHWGVQLETTQKLVKCSLNLLENLPAAREIIFEYFSLVFEVSVGNYIVSMEKNNQQAPDDEIIAEIQITLENLVENSAAWAPLISTWSLRMLGKLADKHSRRRTMDIVTDCNYWMGSNAIRCLLGLSALCFSKLNNQETENCISDLLTIFSKGNHFDWVVARLGSCFPLKVISKILHCGLKSFTANLNSTLESEVGILSYLSNSHEKDLKYALNEMLDAVLKNEVSSQSNFNTIPYLLYLSDKSESLSQPIINVFLSLYSPAFVEKIKIQVAFWPVNYNPTNLLPLLSKLMLKTKDNGTLLVMTLAKVSKDYLWCQELLELLLTEMEALVFDDRSCALFADIVRDDSRKMLWNACTSSNSIEQQTALRLILYVSSSKSPLIYYQSICELMTKSSQLHPNVLNSLVRLIGGPYGIIDQPEVKPGINIVLEEVTLINSSKRNHNQNYYILKNLVDLVALEKSNQYHHLKKCLVTQALIESLGKLIAIWEKLMISVEDEIEDSTISANDENSKEILKKIKLESEKDGMEIEEPDQEHEFKIKDQIHILAKLFDLLDFKTSLVNACDGFRMIRITIKYFFWCLVEKDQITHIQSVNRCIGFLSKQCMGKKAIRTAAIKDLLEGAIFLYGNLFGAPTAEESDKVPAYSKRDDLLMRLNQKQGVSSIVSRSSVLHSGVIGIGIPKLAMQWSDGPEKVIKNEFLNALIACCQDHDMANTIDGFSNVSLLLIEMISTDVMYNGLVWPDDDFTKITMERDLQIRRTFRNSPILWSILGVIAAYRPALCYCSVFLRAICASVIHQWRAKSTENVIGNNVELMFFTSKLLEIMSVGQLLPAPLSYLHVVINYLEPNEIAYVLKECVWNFMMAHVPSPALFSCNSSGLYSRDQENSPPAQFVDPLRNTIQKRLSTMGHLYYQLFVLPEQIEGKKEE